MFKRSEFSKNEAANLLNYHMHVICCTKSDLTIHGVRLLGWWSIDEGSREEQARLYHEGASG